MASSIETTGLEELRAAFNRLANVAEATALVGAQATTGSVKRKRPTPRDEQSYRTAGQNVIILRTHAKGFQSKLGGQVPARKVNFLTDEQRAWGLAVWQEAVNKFMANGIEADLDAAARRVAEFMRDAYRQHIKDSQGPDGPLAPVATATQKQKDREVGPGKPPLERTGQLMASMIYDGKRGRL